MSYSFYKALTQDHTLVPNTDQANFPMRVALKTVVSAYSYARTLVVDHTKVPNTDQTNFPVLVSLTLTSLKTTGNGGHVTNANGYDVTFYSDAALTTALSFELERYNASTGEYIGWVKIPTLSHTTDTPIYMAYGNSSISTNPSSTAAWNSNYKGVWHMKDGTTLSVADSTSNANNGTNNGSVLAGAGKIDGAAIWSGTNAAQSITVKSGPILSGQSSWTVSAWINTTGDGGLNSSGGGRALYAERAVSGNDILKLVQNDGVYPNKAQIGYRDDAGTLNRTGGTTTVNDGVNHYIVAVLAAGTFNLYVDGVLDGTSTQTASNTLTNSVVSVIGNDPADSNGTWQNMMDETRVSFAASSADWVSTEYNNQNSPSTFMSTGNEFTMLGAISSSSGYDIGFYTSSALTTPLSWEIDFYNSTYKEYTAWVSIPTLSHTTDTVIYCAYNDASISSNPSTTSTWDTNTKGVYHLANGTTLSGTDSTTSPSNGTLTNTPTATSGQIDGAGNFVAASDQYIDIGNPTKFQITGNLTLSAWIYIASTPGAPGDSYQVISKDSSTGGRAYTFEVYNDGGNGYGNGAGIFPRLYINGGSGPPQTNGGNLVIGTTALSLNTWYHITGIYDTGGNLYMLLNGNIVGSCSGNATSIPTATTNVLLARRGYPSFNQPFDGKLDEMVIENTNRSADWVKTKYNNQSSLSTFYSLGTQQTIATGPTITGILSIQGISTIQF